MIDLTFCMAFGSLDQPAVWAASTQVDEGEIPQVGMRTTVSLARIGIAPQEMESLESDDSIVAEVAHMDYNDADDLVAYLYAGPDLPDADTCAKLAEAYWVKLDDLAARGVMDIVEAAPVTAAIHDVVIIVGDPTELDEDGNPRVHLWNSALLPDDPIVPMFGDRLLMDIFSDDEDEELDEEDSEAVSFMPVTPVDVYEPGTLERGLPTAVVYSAKSDMGEAQVALWAPSLGEVTEFDMVACGWESMSLEEFDPIEFRLADRVALALRTKLVIDIDDEGEFYLADFELADAANVAPEDYTLLPPVLVEHCRAAREMENIDDIVAGWSSEDE